MKRTLSLKSEALTELTPGELRDVAGGNDTRNCASRDCQTPQCPSWDLVCRATEVTDTIAIQLPTESCH